MPADFTSEVPDASFTFRICYTCYRCSVSRECREKAERKQRESRNCLPILPHYGKGEGHSAFCITCPVGRVVGQVLAAPSGSGIMARQWACGYSSGYSWIFPLLKKKSEIPFTPRWAQTLLFFIFPLGRVAYLYLPQSPYLGFLPPLIFFVLSAQLSYTSSFGYIRVLVRNI